MRLIEAQNLIVNYIMNNIHEKICKYGTYYYPATKHYDGASNGVECDRCYKVNLDACIGWDRYDLCLECASIIANIIKKNKKQEVKMEYRGQYMTNMMQDQYMTNMMQDQFRNPDIGNLTFMMQDQFGSFDQNNMCTYMLQDQYQPLNRNLSVMQDKELTRMAQNMYFKKNNK